MVVRRKSPAQMPMWSNGRASDFQSDRAGSTPVIGSSNIVESLNGMTWDFDSQIVGSNPTATAQITTIKGVFKINKYKAMKVNGIKVNVHRFLMEQHLGRKLESYEVVHHIDGNKNNNALENLCVMTRSEHARLHGKKRECSKETREKQSKAALGKPRKDLRVLTDEQILYIRKVYRPKDPQFGVRALSRKFGVCHATIERSLNEEICVC